MTGQLIVFSGLDGAGKTTQITRITNLLEQHSQKTAYIWTRIGFTPLFDGLRHRLPKSPSTLPKPKDNGQQQHSEQQQHSGQQQHNKQQQYTLNKRLSKKWIRVIWQTLSILELMWIYGLKIRWLRWRDNTVICDRYIWDSAVDLRLKFPDDHVETWLLWRLLTYVTPRPDHSFMMLIATEESERRSRQRNEPFPDSTETLQKRLAFYQTMLKQDLFHFIDGTRDLDKINQEVDKILAENHA